MPIHNRQHGNAKKSTLAVARDLRGIMQTRVPKPTLEILRVSKKVADALDLQAYVVGGFVRDLLMAVGNFDVDLVVEGDGLRFARQLAKRLGGKLRTYERFGTAVIALANRRRVDVATARTETYAHPAALPEVKPASIQQDLRRRDFSVNAMAIQINGRSRGRLLDYFDGLKDLRARKIRALHALSFVDDPTRIFRAIRFEQRYHFSLERATARWMRDALKAGGVERLSRFRVTTEFKKILAEEQPRRCFRRLEQMGFEFGPRYTAILQALKADQ